MSKWEGNIGGWLGAGSSSSVYRIDDARAIKLFTSIAGLRNEQIIYEKLGSHERLVKLHGFGSSYILMDWIVNGDLARFIEETQASHIASSFDGKLENFLVDENYDLKICDFEGSHNHEAPSTSVALQPSRYRRPVDDFKEEVFNPADDIFAFGSICYETINGGPVFPSLDDESMEHQFGLGNFPETKDLCFGHVIQGCWTLSFTSFEEVLDAVRKE